MRTLGAGKQKALTRKKSKSKLNWSMTQTMMNKLLHSQVCYLGKPII